MTKLVIYRNNSAYEQFLAPVISNRNGFETQVFPLGTPKEEITSWFTGHVDKIHSMEKVYLDETCYEAGDEIPDLFRYGKTNYGEFGFRSAAQTSLAKATVEETIAEVVERMLAKKEVPNEVFVIQESMGDHNLFGSLSAHGDWERAAQEDAEKLRLCLKKVTGLPVTVIENTRPRDPNRLVLSQFDGTPLWERSAGDTAWVFYDRHNHVCQEVDKNKFPDVRWFRVPIENLVQDALAFGIELDTEAYSRAIREIVATW